MKKNNERVKSFIITITGPSLSGKSLLVKKIKNLARTLKGNNYSFSPVVICKETTRDLRIEEIKSLDKNINIDVNPVGQISNNCDLVYQSYGMHYGLNTKTIEKELKDGKSPIAVINNIKAVEELKQVFPNQVLSIFVFRRIPDFVDFEKVARLRGNISESEVYARCEESRTIYRMYIENIALFDKVLLNTIEYSKSDLHEFNKNIIDKQLYNIVKGVLDKKICLRKSTSELRGETKKTFILAGGGSSGKAEIIRVLKDMGKLQAEIIPKFTFRDKKEDDEEMIWDSMNTGYHQVTTISDAYPINQLKEKFGNVVVLIYILANAERPSKEVDLFINNFDKFQHVLICKDNYEDLYDQLFRLFRAY